MSIETQVLPAGTPESLELALEVLSSGGLVAFPTDTVYGLAAPAFSAHGIERLFEAKGREAGKAIAILITGLDQAGRLTSELTPLARRLAGVFWPGALTLVVPRHPDLPQNISPSATIGIRMPDHPFTLALLKQSGPLATTSANLSGGPNPLAAADVLAQLGGRIELILDGGRTPGSIPSTVVDCTQPDPIILRAGAISEERLKQALSLP